MTPSQTIQHSVSSQSQSLYLTIIFPKEGTNSKSTVSCKFFPAEPAAFASVSLDRGREVFESEEKELMNEVRRLREKLAMESRNKKAPVTEEERPH